jgi:transposase
VGSPRLSPRQRIILFDYDPSRGHGVAERLLDGVHGTLQSDGHRAYDQVAAKYDLIHCGCIAHARRKFFDAIKALPKDAQKNPTAAHEAVRRIDELYKLERDISTFSDTERRAVRQERAVPLLESLHAWASGLLQQTLPSGKLGEAFTYLLRQWPKLIRYAEDGQVAIDTNLAENAIRPFALGRRGQGQRPSLQPGANRASQRTRAVCVSAPLVRAAAGGAERR